MSIREEIQYEMWIDWSPIWPVFLSACSHSAESGGSVEVSQQHSLKLRTRGAGGKLLLQQWPGLINLLVTPNISMLISRLA